jgi:adenylate kinase
MSRIIFVGGLIPATHITAGQLIREAAAPGHVVTVGAQDKAVPDVDANQVILLRGLVAYRARNASDLRVLLLDGHFSLWNASGAVEDVPLGVFKAIAPVALLLIEAPPVTVHGRLASRAADPPSVETIERLAEHERRRALETAKALNIPIWHAAGDRVADEEARTMVGRIRAVGGGA